MASDKSIIAIANFFYIWRKSDIIYEKIELSYNFSKEEVLMYEYKVGGKSFIIFKKAE